MFRPARALARLPRRADDTSTRAHVEGDSTRASQPRACASRLAAAQREQDQEEPVEVEKSTSATFSGNGHRCARRVGAVNAATEKRERARDSTRNAFCELVLVTARRQQGEVQK